MAAKISQTFALLMAAESVVSGRLPLPAFLQLSKAAARRPMAPYGIIGHQELVVKAVETRAIAETTAVDTAPSGTPTPISLSPRLSAPLPRLPLPPISARLIAAWVQAAITAKLLVPQMKCAQQVVRWRVRHLPRKTGTIGPLFRKTRPVTSARPRLHSPRRAGAAAGRRTK